MSEEKRLTRKERRLASKGKSAVEKSLQRKVLDLIQQRKWHILFVCIVAVCMGGWYFVASTKWYVDSILTPYASFLARVTSFVLNVLGYGTTAVLNMVSGTQTLSVALGCDALEPTFLLLVIIAAYPMYHRYKLAGILAGAFVLWCLNIVRLTSLYILVVHKPELFEVFHMEVWQPLFVFTALVLFFLWLHSSERMQRKSKFSPLSPSDGAL